MPVHLGGVHRDVKKQQHFLLTLLKVSRQNQVSGVCATCARFNGAAALRLCRPEVTSIWGAKGVCRVGVTFKGEDSS